MHSFMLLLLMCLIAEENMTCVSLKWIDFFTLVTSSGKQ